jgi:hypothetical protein
MSEIEDMMGESRSTHEACKILPKFESQILIGDFFGDLGVDRIKILEVILKK